MEGAKVELIGYDGVERVSKRAVEMKERFEVVVAAIDGSSENKKMDIARRAQVVLCAGKAGVRVLTKDQLGSAKDLLVAADVNAVPPLGIEGLDVSDNGEEIGQTGTLGIGALAIGNIKYQTESGLFKRMIEASKTVHFDFRDAFELARRINS